MVRSVPSRSNQVAIVCCLSEHLYEEFFTDEVVAVVMNTARWPLWIAYPFEGRWYGVRLREFYDEGRTQLPDGRVLEPIGWEPTEPPKLIGVREAATDS